MLSEKIKRLRQACGLNQVELGEKLSVTKQTVSNWENNNIMPSVEVLIKIADYFGVSTDFLLDRETEITINATGLSAEQIEHINLLIKDLKNAGLK